MSLENIDDVVAVMSKPHPFPRFIACKIDLKNAEFYRYRPGLETSAGNDLHMTSIRNARVASMSCQEFSSTTDSGLCLNLWIFMALEQSTA